MCDRSRQAGPQGPGSGTQRFDYVHWDERLGELSLDFYALPEDLEKAKKQFAQARGMIEAFQHYLGEYPFKKDGYKLIQAPSSVGLLPRSLTRCEVPRAFK